ncbi:MFS general substrate transporter [Aspergillus campestris IBT 28561]|uniref:MFS general substrate transporter n=1 Tax=Aspergillus campestris (strain IBT 28561) TaxID=1392248 RepID=A0A2I1CY52_ASPC2|nr:MFS general substrate transporter [Aspergillus campestris IBT 28561]PKY02548.1 MFS general substrate transporter [Aspergillus campestris IBT 28561]
MVKAAPTNQVALQYALEDQGLERTGDEKNLVRWATTNPKHPKNWSPLRKAYDVTIIILLEFYTYLLAQGIGSVIFPPYSECFGRKRLYVVSTVFYSIFCAATGAISHPAAGAVGRLATGFLSAVPSVVVAGSVEDIFDIRERIWITFPYLAAANFGIAAGPVMSAYITADWGWQWVFYSAAIVTAFLAVLLLTIRESRPSLVLEREVAQLRKITGDESLQALNPDKVPDMQTFARNVVFRPAQLLATEPIIMAVSVVCGVSSGIIYLFTDVLPPVYKSFGFSTTRASLPFIAIGLGFLPNILTRFIEYRMADKCRKRGDPVLPEQKLIGYIIAAPVLMGGLWWFSWTIPPDIHVHWFISVIPLFFVGFAINEFGVVLVGYMMDSYLLFSASSFAALCIVRCILAASFPLFARRMFDGLGPNMAVSVLAIVATIFCGIAPLLRMYGERLRKNSKFAAHSLKVHSENTVEEAVP